MAVHHATQETPGQYLPRLPFASTVQSDAGFRAALSLATA
jgi:hypothetical protein